jgi:hypothetical protein
MGLAGRFIGRLRPGEQLEPHRGRFGPLARDDLEVGGDLDLAGRARRLLADRQVEVVAARARELRLLARAGRADPDLRLRLAGSELEAGAARLAARDLEREEDAAGVGERPELQRARCAAGERPAREHLAIGAGLGGQPVLGEAHVRRGLVGGRHLDRADDVLEASELLVGGLERVAAEVPVVEADDQRVGARLERFGERRLVDPDLVADLAADLPVPGQRVVVGPQHGIRRFDQMEEDDRRAGALGQRRDRREGDLDLGELGIAEAQVRRVRLEPRDRARLAPAAGRGREQQDDERRRTARGRKPHRSTSPGR